MRGVLGGVAPVVRFAGVLLAGTLLAGGCASSRSAPSVPTLAPVAPPSPAAAPTAADPPTPAGTPVAQGSLAPPAQADDAYTYDTALAPEGAQLTLYVTPDGTTTHVRLDVEGLVPDRGYAAHAHAKACGTTGDAAGPHFQNHPDPAAGPDHPSTDPAYANPQNEVWLDLHTDDDGNGVATTDVPFTFGDRAPASVVLHEAETTMTGPGTAGTAGGRLACLTATFR